jgi:hypothetical protein
MNYKCPNTPVFKLEVSKIRKKAKKGGRGGGGGERWGRERVGGETGV